MGALVSALAFPVPRLPFAFYNEELLRRDDLVWLYTSKREKIPACHVKASKRSVTDKPPGEGLTILYSHGNAEDLGLHLPFIDALARVRLPGAPFVRACLTQTLADRAFHVRRRRARTSSRTNTSAIRCRASRI